MNKKELAKAQALVNAHRLRALFAEYNLALVLHWNAVLQQYEIRARHPRSQAIEKYVMQLHLFIAKTDSQRRAQLEMLHNEIYQYDT